MTTTTEPRRHFPRRDMKASCRCTRCGNTVPELATVNVGFTSTGICRDCHDELQQLEFQFPVVDL